MYDYLSVPNNENEPDQFFIVQDNGMVLFINKQVQYVAPVQSDQGPSDSVQTCSMYDITPQQVYVDVDSPTELISVGNLVLPDGSNSLYTNSYLMQELPSSAPSQDQEPCLPTSNEQMEEGVLVMNDEFNPNDLKDANLTYTPEVSSDKQITNCTEITLNEDQYKMLEEKGWVLFETNEKTYVLDTLGLHDITNNEDVIRQLKTEIRENALSTQKQDYTIESKNELGFEIKPLKVDNSKSHDEPSSEENKSLLSKFADSTDEKIEEKPPPLISSKRQTLIAECSPQKTVTETQADTKVPQQKETVTVSKSILQRTRQVIKLKTTLAAKDIPDKIVLGKTVNGKKLVARVVKPNKNEITSAESNSSPKNDDKAMDIINNYLSEEQYSDSPELLLENLMNQALKNPKENYDSPHLINIVSNMKHLLTIPVFKQAVASHNLVVTKITKTKQTGAEIVTPTPVLVLGKVVHLEYGSEFIHIPHMLNSLLDGNGSLSLSDIYHVHIIETKKSSGTTEGMSVFIQKRPIPGHPDLVKDKKKIYACSSCASTFSTESALLEHHRECIKDTNSHNIHADTSNTDKDPNASSCNEKPYYTVKGKQGTSYICIKCKMVFNKLYNCQRHVKTHVPQKQPEGSDKKGASKEDLFKCNMCPSGYLHPSSLSKHIVQCHIQNKGT